MEQQDDILFCFLRSSATDASITPMHISLFLAMYGLYRENHNNNPFNVNRRVLMKTSKIHALATYHKCIKYLVQSGYIKYRPSYNPFNGSEVELLPTFINI